jgi:hypothetical protein
VMMKSLAQMTSTFRSAGTPLLQRCETGDASSVMSPGHAGAACLGPGGKRTIL